MLYDVKTKAADDLRFIRHTMERASTFTAVPGWGGVLMGVSAAVAGGLAGPIPSPRWVTVWLVEAGIAAAIGVASILRKARTAQQPLSGATTRRFFFAFLPAAVAGAVLTAAFVARGLLAWLPACWLLLYGAALTSGGALSIPLVPIMGMAFMTLGAAALTVPSRGAVLMMLGFGGLHLIFGALIGVKHGG